MLFQKWSFHLGYAKKEKGEFSKLIIQLIDRGPCYLRIAKFIIIATF